MASAPAIKSVGVPAAPALTPGTGTALAVKPVVVTAVPAVKPARFAGKGVETKDKGRFIGAGVSAPYSGLGPAVVYGLSKSRRVLPFSAENEMACANSYECAPLAKAERVNATVHGFAGFQTMGKAVGVVRPCDPATVASANPFFDSGRKRMFVGVAINYVSQPRNRLTSCWNDIDVLQSEFAKRYGPFYRSWVLTDKVGRPDASGSPTFYPSSAASGAPCCPR